MLPDLRIDNPPCRTSTLYAHIQDCFVFLFNKKSFFAASVLKLVAQSGIEPHIDSLTESGVMSPISIPWLVRAV